MNNEVNYHGNKKVIIEKVNPATRKIDENDILKKMLSHKNMQLDEINTKVNRALKGNSYLDIEMNYIPEEEAEVYGGYYSFGCLKKIHLEYLAQLMSRSLVYNTNNLISLYSPNDNITDNNTIEAISPIIYNLLKKHGFDKVSAYELDVRPDYYEDIVNVKSFNADKLCSFTNELYSLLS